MLKRDYHNVDYFRMPCPICPYCKYEHKEAHIFYEEGVSKCQNCQKLFHLEIKTVFTTWKMSNEE